MITETERTISTEGSSRKTLDYVFYLKPFGDWLVNEKGYHTSTSNRYCSSIKSVDEYLLKNGIITKSVFLCDNNELTSAFNAIFADSSFHSYNKENHYNPSAALQRYYGYKEGHDYLSVSDSSVQIINDKMSTQNQTSDSIKSRSRFDFAEAVILHDGCQKINYGSSRAYIISDISKKLRQMAINQGKKIDASYRSTTVIDYQVNCMLATMTGEDNKSYPSTTIFKNAVSTYEIFRDAYDLVLKWALEKCNPKTVAGIQSQDEIALSEGTNTICPDELKALIAKKFPYGIRTDFIDIQKLRNFAEEEGIEIFEDDDGLVEQIRAGGIENADKRYFISNEVSDKLIENIKSVFNTGVNVIYYDIYFEKNYDWMNENGIASFELMRILLKKYVTNWYFGKNFFCNSTACYSENDAVESELLRVWGDNIIRSYDELYELLPYISEKNIRQYLSSSKMFVWSSEGVFARVDKLIITEEEKQAIFVYVNDTCETVGYASISDIPLGDIEEENYQISISAIYDCIYILVLSDVFTLNGKILNKNNSSIDCLTLTKNYCIGKDKCTFDELNDYVTSINRKMDRQIVFKAAYSQMVRIDKETFVADRLVSFNVDEIDDLLEQSMTGDFMPIKQFFSFSLFPDCGYQWNGFVLESFCLKYSKKFRLSFVSYNSKNVGIIVKTNLNMDYTDILATAVVNANVPLNQDVVGRYLYDNGYTSKRKMRLLDEVIEKAVKIKGAN